MHAFVDPQTYLKFKQAGCTLIVAVAIVARNSNNITIITGLSLQTVTQSLQLSCNLFLPSRSTVRLQLMINVNRTMNYKLMGTSRKRS